MPFCVIFSQWHNVYEFDDSMNMYYLAVATALFALSLPMQGLWWLGKRSVTPLPPAILNWFYEVRGKLQESGQVLAPVEGKPDYQALADTLKRAFKQLDKTFLDDL